MPLVPDGTTVGGTTNLFSPWRKLCHGVKLPDSKPPFTMVGAHVLVKLAEVEEKVVDRVTVVRVDEVVTDA